LQQTAANPALIISRLRFIPSIAKNPMRFAGSIRNLDSAKRAGGNGEATEPLQLIEYGISECVETGTNRYDEPAAHSKHCSYHKECMNRLPESPAKCRFRSLPVSYSSSKTNITTEYMAQNCRYSRNR
jgi:hypothetical protein